MTQTAFYVIGPENEKIRPINKLRVHTRAGFIEGLFLILLLPIRIFRSLRRRRNDQVQEARPPSWSSYVHAQVTSSSSFLFLVETFSLI